MSPRRILFVSPGDAARAQMAAGLLRHLAGGAVGVASASTAVTTPHPAAVQAMAEVGIDLTGHPPQTLDRYAGQAFDEQILLCDGTTDTWLALPGAGQRRMWPIPNPNPTGDAAAQLPAFRRARDDIRRHILTELLTESR